jgi:hypothetical protein
MKVIDARRKRSGGGDLLIKGPCNRFDFVLIRGSGLAFEVRLFH